MSKNRKTITLTETFLRVAEALPKSDRLLYFEALFYHFLDGKPLPDEVPDSVRVALISITPQLRQAASKFDNGRCLKNRPENPRGLSAQILKRNEAKLSETKRVEAGVYKINHPLKSKLLNILYTTDNQPRAGAREPLKKVDDQAALTNLSSLDDDNRQRFKKIAERALRSNELRIGGRALGPAAVKTFLRDLLERSDFADLVRDTFDEVDEAPGISSKFRYTLAVIYNKMYKIKKDRRENRVSGGFQERTYTKEELDKLFDTLDDIELDEEEKKNERREKATTPPKLGLLAPCAPRNRRGEGRRGQCEDSI